MANEEAKAPRWADVENSVLMFKFGRARVVDFICDVLGVTDSEVTLTIMGEPTNGVLFEDTDIILVI